MENQLTPAKFFFLFFPAEIFEISFNPRCEIGWPPGYLYRVLRVEGKSQVQPSLSYRFRFNGTDIFVFEQQEHCIQVFRYINQSPITEKILVDFFKF